MLKRQIKNFRTGRKATLTLVFTSNEPVDTNWFEIKTVDSQEVMYPVLEGETRILNLGLKRKWKQAFHNGNKSFTFTKIPP